MAVTSLDPPHSSEEISSDHRDSPWFLSSNHKLRNLVAVSIRNISLANSRVRHRSHTIDDDALPNTLTSPAKIVALREHRILEHSRSSTDLRASLQDEESLESFDSTASDRPHHGDPRTPPPRPAPRIRRRSTLDWANATPQKRQERLESLTSERMVDVFFTCHVDSLEDPIYISETVSRTMNPTFRNVDFSSCSSAVTRLDAMVLRVWMENPKTEHWQQLLQLNVKLPRLRYIGQTLDQLPDVLPPNSVIFQMVDGLYASSVSFVPCIAQLPAPRTRMVPNRLLPTSSFDALLRLSKLDDSVQDALKTRDKIAADLENLIRSHRMALAQRDAISEANDRLKTIEYAKMTVEKQLVKAHKQQEEKRRALQTRQRLMADDQQRRKLQAGQMRLAQPELPNYREELDIKQKAIQNQRRRICEDLQKCYDIQPVPKETLTFTILDLHLSNSDDLDTESPEDVAAALGFVAQVVVLLSTYLQQPLPYPIQSYCSSSRIEDPLSLLKLANSSGKTANDPAMRIYPLFSKGVPRFRFDYAVFLLNKDIQILLETAFNVRVLDIRQTLPNLKYLFYVATAGAGELPARKAGGVRGLLRPTSGSNAAEGPPRPAAKRFGSDASSDSSPWSVRGREEAGANGKAKGAVESLKKNFAATAGKTQHSLLGRRS